MKHYLKNRRGLSAIFSLLIMLVLIGGVYIYFNPELLDNIPFLNEKYELKISSNTNWMLTGFIETNDGSKPIFVSYNGNYRLKDIPNLKLVDVYVTAFDFGTVSNRRIKIELLKGSEVIASEETSESGVTLKWNKNMGDVFNDDVMTPITYQEFMEMSVYVINKYRNENGLENIKYVQMNISQIHLDDMLINGYMSYYDMKGYNPIMRYSETHRRGYLEEVIITSKRTNDVSETIENALKKIINKNENILNPNTTGVDIGLYLDSENIYMVLNFERDIIGSSSIYFTGYSVGLYLNFYEDIEMKEIKVYYLPLPHNLTLTELAELPYSKGYSRGEYIGSVVPKGENVENGISVEATFWGVRDHLQSGIYSPDPEIKNHLQTMFQMTNFLNEYGKGVYTIFCTDGYSEYLSYSIWINET